MFDNSFNNLVLVSESSNKETSETKPNSFSYI
ncbi:HNH endonuclease domain-containing protein [Psychroserpens algicola]